jgi:hypothetical protein
MLLLAAATLIGTVALEGNTDHVQGIVVDGPTLWVTSVDRGASKGWLFEYELATGKRLRAVELQQGTMFHPGGFDAGDDSLWIPVAEYRPSSRAVIQKRNKLTLAVEAQFEVPDHIGCLTLSGGKLVGANWDARKFYEWSPDGKQLSVRANPNKTRYQDIKQRYGTLIASGAVVEWLDPETLLPLDRFDPGRTDRNTPYANEGMDQRDNLLYFLPEDAPSRLFVFRLGDGQNP